MCDAQLTSPSFRACAFFEIAPAADLAANALPLPLLEVGVVAFAPAEAPAPMAWCQVCFQRPSAVAFQQRLCATLVSRFFLVVGCLLVSCTLCTSGGYGKAGVGSTPSRRGFASPQARLQIAQCKFPHSSSNKILVSKQQADVGFSERVM